MRPGPYARYASDRVYDALERLETWAALRGTTMATVATAWLLHVPEVSAVVVGPKRAEHLDQVRDALELRLTPAERDELRGCVCISVLVLSDEDVRAVLDMESCIEAMTEVLASLARGGCTSRCASSSARRPTS